MTDLCSGMDLQFACINMLVCFFITCFISYAKLAPREEKITIIYHRRPWEILDSLGAHRLPLNQSKVSPAHSSDFILFL